MSRVQWCSSLLIATLWAVVAGRAEAQIGPLYSYVDFDTFIDVTYTGNGRSVRCTSPDIVGGPRVVQAILQPEVGTENVLTQRFFCGDVAIDIFRDIVVGDTRVIENEIRPIWADYYTRISVVTDGGGGESIIAGEVSGTLILGEGTGHWPYLDNLHNLPGVVFHNLVDDITDRLVQ
jgi:hypothetical protein